MNRLYAITRDDSETIGFVITSLFCSAIDLKEFHEWCYKIIREHELEELPPYIMELAEFEGALAKLFKVLGFVPSWKHDQDDEAALCGIAMNRGAHRVEWPVSRETALDALRSRPEIESRFRMTFPFVNY
jgi:hypothetical protein